MAAAKNRSAAGRRTINATYARLLEDFRKLSTDEQEENAVDVLDPDSNIFPERPSTPIMENVIMTPPKDLEELQTLIKRRTQPSLERCSLTVQQQRELTSTLHAQVNAVWQELSQQADDSRLTSEQNIELRVRMTAYIVTTCQELFKYYLKQYEAMRRREFYTDHANFTRLKVQLASDGQKLLNMQTIRRYIASDILCPPVAEKAKERATPSRIRKPLSQKRLLAASQPKPKRKQGPLTLEEQIQKLKDDLPELHAGQLRQATMALRQIAEKLQQNLLEVPHDETLDVTGQTAKLRALGRSCSLPNLHQYDSLFEEYDISDEDCCLPYKECDEKSLKFEHTLKSQKLNLQKLIQSKDTKSDLKKDLKMLIEYERVKQDDDGADSNVLLEFGLQDDSRMPPLISVIMNEYKQIAKARRAKMEELEKKKQQNAQKLLELNEEHNALLGNPQDYLRFDQPFVHTMQLSALNPARWKVACGRVSERQCKSFLHLDAHSTLWNELQDEIDEQMIEHLDRNLYAGREIKEVYAGMMSTVKTDHLEASLDEAIEDCPLELATEGLFASGSYKLELDRSSSTASMTPDENKDKDANELFNEDGRFNHSAFTHNRILNEQLVPSNSRAPWHDIGLQEWAKLSFIPKEKKISSVEEMERNSPMYIRLLEILNDKFRKLAHLDNAGANLVALPLNANQTSKPPAEVTMAAQFEDNVPKSAVLVTLDELRTTLASTPRNVQDKMLKQYKTLVTRWMDVVDTDDYLKFLLTQDTDYLGLIFHLYEEQEESCPPGTASEDRSRTSTLLNAQLAAKRRELEQRLDEMKKAKSVYTPGEWNVNTVLLGGLGRDPSIQEVLAIEKREGGEPESADRSAIESALDGNDSVTASKSASRQANIQSELIQYGEAQQRRLSTLQDRLEAIWSHLAMPDNLRLDMAIKYSGERHAPLLERAVRRWEKVVANILHREALLAELEQFERDAGDPRAYAKKSSVIQQKENRRRAQLEQRLSQIEPDIRRRLAAIEREFQDTVTFKGRPYLDKMQRDKIEMLFWLEEERKELVLKRQRMLQHLQAQVSTTHPADSYSKASLQTNAAALDASSLIRVMPAYAGVKLQPL